MPEICWRLGGSSLKVPRFAPPPQISLVLPYHASATHSQPSLGSLLESYVPLGQPGKHTPSAHALPPPQAAPFMARLVVQPLPGVQLSTVHGLPSSHWMVVLTQVVPLQTALAVQMSPSLQLAPGTAVKTQPLAGSQTSELQALPSSQVPGVPLQLPPEHTSVVQAMPSSHGPLLSGACVQAPDLLSQLSAVQGLESAQLMALPLHLPFVHASPLVQSEPSVQVPLLAKCTHALLLQESCVHASPSSQLTS